MGYMKEEAQVSAIQGQWFRWGAGYMKGLLKCLSGRGMNENKRYVEVLGTYFGSTTLLLK